MQMSIEQLEGGVIRVVLEGRLDVAGAQDFNFKMNDFAGSRKAVLIDMQQVSFIGSMGLRTLVAQAQAIKGDGGKIVMLRPNEMVEKVLKSSAIESLIPIHPELQGAIAALR